MQQASKSSELDAASAELDSSKFCLYFPEDGLSLMQGKLQTQGHPLSEVDARILMQMARKAADSIVQWFAASESASGGEVKRLIRLVGNLGGKVNRLGENCDCKVKDVFSNMVAYNGVSMRRPQNYEACTAY